MANADFQTFLEDRLRALDPSIDLDPGSPAQVQFIAPVLARLGTDPFETDISSFIQDRYAQEFPDIYAGDPGAVHDLFVKPLIVLLEPLKREIENVKRTKSLKDPSLLTDEEADALAANVFEERDSGGFSTGNARLFFANPSNVQVGISSRFFTASGLNYFPTSPLSVTAEEMVFNRAGSLFFVDVPLKAETEGDEYNIDENTLSGAEGISGVVRVTNLRKFENGSPRIDTATFVATAREALNERSLVTRRGAVARLRQVFRNSTRAIQVIGGRDVEMQRDILVAESPGHAWLLGEVAIYGNLALVQCRVVDDPAATATPASGDTLFLYLSKYLSGFTSLDQSKRLIRLKVEEVLAGPMQQSVPPFQVGFLVRWSGDLPTGVTLPTALVAEGGFSKKGTVRISSLASLGAADFSVNNGEVHLYGHTDIYVRPVLQTVDKAVLSGLVDDAGTGAFRIQRSTLSTNATNRVEDPSFDFETNGVEVGDLLTIESGDDAGTYRVLKTDGDQAYLNQNLTRSATNLRYRVTKRIRVNLFEPKIPKIPFGDVANNDLETDIESNIFNVGTDLLAYGVVAGDVIRVKTGPDAGDFVIQGFSGGGQAVIVDRKAGATNAGLVYEVFTALDPVVRPLVRIKELLLLDSSQQSSGITIPPADPVGAVPTSDFTSAQVRGRSQRRTGFVLPSLSKADGSDPYVSGGNVAAASGDRRYSLGFDDASGTYKAMLFADGSQAELDFPTDAFTKCSYFLATSEDESKSENFPPIAPNTGDALTIKNGPNKGSYLIEKVRKFRYKTADSNTVWLYLIKIYGTFPVDVLRDLVQFLDDNGQTVPKVAGSSGTVAFPSFFQDIYNGLGNQLSLALSSLGVTSPGASTLQEGIDDLAAVDYEWGDPARGTIRTFFQQPTLFQQHTALHDNPTLFAFKNGSGESVFFRADPTRYLRHEVIPARLESDSDALDYPRDLDTTDPTEPSFTDTNTSSMFVSGVLPGDILEVFPENLFHGSTGVSGDRQTAIQTVTGSTTVTTPAASGDVFTADMVGNLLFVEEGTDKGGYRITQFISPSAVVVDRPLSESTPALLSAVGVSSQGSGASWGLDGSDNKISMPSTQGWSSALINKYITLYGIDSEYQGSYKILSAPDNKTLLVDRLSIGTDFPAYPQGGGFWVITEGPDEVPTTRESGTELHALRPIRVYDDIVQEFVISDVPTDATSSSLVVSGSVPDGVKQPYRIYRPNLRRVNPTEMSKKADGALFYFDTEVVSLSPNTSSNVSRKSYGEVVADTFESYGYRHVVDDFTLSYSMQETGFLEISAEVLPVDSVDSVDNLISLAQAPIQVSYERADLVQQFQEFLDSPSDRDTASNMLARHFLPAYVSYDATYTGGSAPSVIAKDIIDSINSLAVEAPIDVSDLQKLIDKRGGDPETPTKVVALVHDWDRRVWVEFSENRVGLVDETNPTKSSVPYHGTPRVTYFIPGNDVSGSQVVPYGERIKLTRE
jgi:hypothetical protein